MNSPLASEVLPGPTGICSTGTSRVPFGPMMRAIAPAAITGGTLSAAGDPLQRLPPIEARPLIWIEPISLTPSTTPGQALQKAACSTISMPGTAAPTRKPPFSALSSRVSAIFLMSTSSAGSIRSVSICTITSVPPASTRAGPLAPASSETAACSVCGASYLTSTIMILKVGSAVWRQYVLKSAPGQAPRRAPSASPLTGSRCGARGVLLGTLCGLEQLLDLRPGIRREVLERRPIGVGHALENRFLYRPSVAHAPPPIGDRGISIPHAGKAEQFE